MPTCLSTPTTSRLAWTELSYGSNFRGRSKNRGYKMSQETCRNCHGTGKCPSCKGRGHHPLYTYKECPDCGGTGRCQECRGYGKVRRQLVTIYVENSLKATYRPLLNLGQRPIDERRNSCLLSSEGTSSTKLRVNRVRHQRPQDKCYNRVIRHPVVCAYKKGVERLLTVPKGTVNAIIP